MARTTTLATSRPAAIERGFAEIAAWHVWFVAAHRQRLAADGLDPESIDRAMGPIVTLADNITQRMRDDFLARRT